MEENELKETYLEDTIGKRWRKPIVSKTPYPKTPDKKSEIVTANIHKRMDNKTFRKLHKKTQTEYILSLRNKFGVNNKEIAEMLGVDLSTYCKKCKELGIATGRGAKRKTPEQQKMWEAFLNGDMSITDEIIQDNLENPSTELKMPDFGVLPHSDTTAKSNFTPEDTKKDDLCSGGMDFDEICLTYKGNLNSEFLARKISALCDNGTYCKVTITLTKEVQP